MLIDYGGGKLNVLWKCFLQTAYVTYNFMINIIKVTLLGSRQRFSIKYIYIKKSVDRSLYDYICRNLYSFYVYVYYEFIRLNSL